MPSWNEILGSQLDAAVTTLRNAIEACPPAAWEGPCGRGTFWGTAFHALFWLDLYADESLEAFAPRPELGASELEEEGVPPRVFTREELLDYLEHGRAKGRARVASLAEADLARPSGFPWLARRGLSVAETALYNLRHVQHHAAQLNLVLRQVVDHAAPWVSRGG